MLRPLTSLPSPQRKLAPLLKAAIVEGAKTTATETVMEFVNDEPSSSELFGSEAEIEKSVLKVYLPLTTTV